MPFNSYIFIGVFLPITLGVGLWLQICRRHDLEVLWLLAASLVFYGWGEPLFTLVLGASLAANFALGDVVRKQPASTGRTALVAWGVAANLAVLGWFKYRNFILENWGAMTGEPVSVAGLVLPLGISFFTFQQIAYLIDCHNGHQPVGDFRRYALFVTFFPHLIAGPLVHHREMIPQFGRERPRRLIERDLAVGLTLFAIGLFKKVALADWFAFYTDHGFGSLEPGMKPSLFEAWFLALSFSLQIYLDFSAYSDMALGLARALGIRLPENFRSPYKATSVIDFWRRWHITLSRFLREYLYQPLGGSRRGYPRQLANLLIVMLLAGLWHGAGWGFVLWGAVHGLALVINHGWRRLAPRPLSEGGWAVRALATGAVFAFVTFAWVPFRASKLWQVGALWRGMLLGNGLSLPFQLKPLLGSAAESLTGIGIHFDSAVPNGLVAFPTVALPAALLTLAGMWLLPNALEITARAKPALPLAGPLVAAGRLAWRPSTGWAIASGALLMLGIFGIAHAKSFIYFQF